MIKEFIANYITSRLQPGRTMVMYDGQHLYSSMLPLLQQRGVTIFSAAENILTAREDAQEYYANLHKDKDARMLVYVPYAAPVTEQEKVDDPFFIFSLGGRAFPADANDEYEAMARACFPGNDTSIAELFADAIPDFSTLDALGSGRTFAKLQSLTGVKSEEEIICALLCPDEELKSKLEKDKTWQKEYRELAKITGLISSAANYKEINAELWRFMLFSEFVLDLPVPLPQSLSKIPVASGHAAATVFQVCKTIRQSSTMEETYLQQAEKVAAELSLPTIFKDETNLGDIITFSFENNTYFARCISYLMENNLVEASRIISTSRRNIWSSYDSDTRSSWLLADLAVQLLKKIKMVDSPVADLQKVVTWYTGEGYKLDQLQRGFESEFMKVLQPSQMLNNLRTLIHSKYLHFAEKNQKIYQQAVVQEHWPLSGMLSNTQVYNKYIAPGLKSGSRTAYLVVDALRFELAKELESQLSLHFDVEVEPSCAYLPTVTKFGMAALLPDAEKLLHLDEHKGSLEAFMGDRVLLTLQNRRQYVVEKLGDRCRIESLESLVAAGTVPVVDLLMITTSEIDAAGENLTTSLPAMQHAVQNILRCLYLISQDGYDKIVVATDHGFVLHPYFQTGDSIAKPAGNWLMSKLRSLAGKGDVPEYTWGFSPENLGIRSSQETFLFLKNFAVFEKNATYFHEGLSLQENIVPVMKITSQKKKPIREEITVNITYKGKTTGNITTRRPSFELASFSETSLGLETTQLKIEAIAEGDRIVGNPVSGEKVNATTRFVEINAGESFKLGFEMDPDFEGPFTVVVSDPVTGKMYSSVEIKTDYIS